MAAHQYNSGLCNIGDKEIAVRQKLLLFALFATVVSTALVHFFHSHVVCFLVFASTFFTILLFIEVRTGFCIMFGFFKLYNFKHLGNLDTVDDKRCNRKDRMKAAKILVGAILISLPYTWMVYKIAA